MQGIYGGDRVIDKINVYAIRVMLLKERKDNGDH